MFAEFYHVDTLFIVVIVRVWCCVSRSVSRWPSPSVYCNFFVESINVIL